MPLSPACPKPPPCSTYNLLNWQRLDPAGPVQLGNIACLHNFLGGIDEEWFRLIHVQIEQQAAAAVAGLPAAQAAAAAGDAAGVRQALEAVTAALVAMQVRPRVCWRLHCWHLGYPCKPKAKEHLPAVYRHPDQPNVPSQATLGRMAEKCDPAIYYARVRLPMSGWRNNPALPHGLVYEGQFGGQVREARGHVACAWCRDLRALDLLWHGAWCGDVPRHKRQHAPLTCYLPAFR